MEKKHGQASKYVRHSIKDPITGKRKYFYGRTEREVQRKIFEFEERGVRGMTFKEVSDEWWSLEVVNLSPSTVAGYKRATERARTCGFSRYSHYIQDCARVSCSV